MTQELGIEDHGGVGQRDKVDSDDEDIPGLGTAYEKAWQRERAVLFRELNVAWGQVTLGYSMGLVWKEIGLGLGCS